MRTGQRFGAAHLADVLRGDATDAIARHGHDRLKTFGVGKERSRRAWMATVRQLFAAGALAEASEEHGGFRLTEKGEAILFGRETITLRTVIEPVSGRRDRRTRDAGRAARRDGLDPAAAALFERLRALRHALAKEEGIAAFMIFPDRTLIEIAQLQARDASASFAPSTASASANLPAMATHFCRKSPPQRNRAASHELRPFGRNSAFRDAGRTEVNLQQASVLTTRRCDTRLYE